MRKTLSIRTSCFAGTLMRGQETWINGYKKVKRIYMNLSYQSYVATDSHRIVSRDVSYLWFDYSEWNMPRWWAWKLTYVCSTGSRAIDYFISYIEIAKKVAKYEVTEPFESKHLPVEIQIGRRSKNSVPKHNSPGHVEKLIWDDNKRSDFEQNVRKEQFMKKLTEQRFPCNCL